jgi:peptidoglycan hydrolase-like protein with peptidoglycan-binding domain
VSVIAIVVLIFLLIPPSSAKAASMPVLKLGSKGNEVYALQYLLIDKGYNLASDGVFGRGTLKAVKSFQQEKGLEEDGAVGKRTWFELAPKQSASSYSPYASKALQHLLKHKFSFSFLDVDGIFGGATRKASIAFQKAFGLDQDGIVGLDTWISMLGSSASDLHFYPGASLFWKGKRDEGWCHPIPLGASISTQPFGQARSSGERTHAAIDYIVDVGTNVLAVADGEVIASKMFYFGTDEVQVKHLDGSVSRYGEIESFVSVGKKVKKGEALGKVIKNSENNLHMLHFEMYFGWDASGNEVVGDLTDEKAKSGSYLYVDSGRHGSGFQRRRDLIDPTGSQLLARR